MEELISEGVISRESVVSTDELRIKLTGNVWDQSANGTVFAIIDRMVHERLKRGLDVWHDATNLTSAWRYKAVDEAQRWGQPIINILMTANNDTCRARNAARNPPIPDEVMDAMFEHRRTCTRGLVGKVVTDTDMLGSPPNQPQGDST